MELTKKIYVYLIVGFLLIWYNYIYKEKGGVTILSATLENMSNDLVKNNNVNDYLNEVSNEKKESFFNYSIEELENYITNKTQNIFKLFTSIFIVGGLIAIAFLILFLPMINQSYSVKTALDEQSMKYHIDHSDNPKKEISDAQTNIQDSLFSNSDVPQVFLLTLTLGLFLSLVAFIIPAIFLSFSKVSLKKYRKLLAELKEQRYIYLSKN